MVQRQGFASGDQADLEGLSLDRLPQNEDEAHIANRALEREMEKLSLEEYEKIILDVHGFQTESDDRQEQEKEKKLLKKLEFELSFIKSTKKSALERAKQMNQSYVESQSMLFLRSERLNPKFAADRMVDHYEMKQQIFGNEILARDVYLSDLDKDDIECLKAGFLQVCPSRDVAGRTVVYFSSTLRKFKTVLNYKRAIWYFIMALLKEEETQKKGVVAIMQNFGNNVEKLGFMKKMRKMQTSLPLRFEAGHYCYSNSSLRPSIVGMQLFLFNRNSHRLRLRAHFGTPNEIDFALQTFGIPTAESPLIVDESSGNFSYSTSWHHEWFRMQQAREESALNNESLIIVPRRFDVLFGKGDNARKHTGNRRCQHLVEMNMNRYEMASRHDKTKVADDIISIVHESQGRFLKWEKDAWIKVEQKVAREKISHFFRHARSKKTVTPQKRQTCVAKRTFADAAFSPRAPLQSVDT